MKKLVCNFCGDTFDVYPYRENVAKYCSRRCGSADKKETTKNRWSGGRILKPNGYIMLRINKKYVYEHRHVMAQFLGRKLKRNEIVHHKNKNKTDNRLSNLELLNKNQHDRYETLLRWRTNPDSFIKRGYNDTAIHNCSS